LDDGRYNPAIDTTYFPNTVSSHYWSSTTYAGYTYGAWGVYFGFGAGSSHDKPDGQYVRAVRGGQSGSVAKFIFPVLGISVTDPLKNVNDPLNDGWAGKGVGQLCAAEGHLGQDYYLRNGDCAGKPVFTIYDGQVVEVMNGPGKYGWCDDSDHGWGPVVVVKHTSNEGFKVSKNAIISLGDCGTDEKPKVIYSLYGHLSKESIKNISVGRVLKTGDQIGVIGKYGVDQNSWTTNHLHFEIKDEAGFSEGAWYTSNPGECPGSATQSCDAIGVGTGYSYRKGFAPHRYIPLFFISDNNFSSVRFISMDGTCGGKEPCYSTIQTAIDSASTGSLILIAGGTYSGSITLNSIKSVTLQGGLDATFGTYTGTTILKSAPKAPQGSLTLNNLKIVP